MYILAEQILITEIKPDEEEKGQNQNSKETSDRYAK